jgi:hypothetical protein
MSTFSDPSAKSTMKVKDRLPRSREMTRPDESVMTIG